MKKKFLVLLLATSMTFSTVACGSAKEDAKEASQEEQTETPAESDSSEEEPETDSEKEDLSSLDALGEVEVEKELFDVTLNIPSEYVGESTQEDLDAQASKYGYKVTLNSDGTATYTMTKKQHKQMLEDLSANINSTLSEMIGSEDYPNITDITANKNFTSFTITTTSTELDMNESFSVMAFYMYGGMYNIFSGEAIDNVHVDFVNAKTGEVISSGDSSEMNSES